MTAFDLTKDEIEKVFPSIRVDAFVRKPVGIVKLMDHLNVRILTTTITRRNFESSCFYESHYDNNN